MQPEQKKINFIKHFIRGSKPNKRVRSAPIRNAIADLESGNETALLALLNEFHLTRYSRMLLSLLTSNYFQFDLPTRIDDKTRIYSVSVQNVVTAFRSGAPNSIWFFVEKLDRNDMKLTDSLCLGSAQQVDAMDYDTATIGYLSSSQQDLDASLSEPQQSLSEQLYAMLSQSTLFPILFEDNFEYDNDSSESLKLQLESKFDVHTYFPTRDFVLSPECTLEERLQLDASESKEIGVHLYINDLNHLIAQSGAVHFFEPSALLSRYKREVNVEYNAEYHQLTLATHK